MAAKKHQEFDDDYPARAAHRRVRTVFEDGILVEFLAAKWNR